MRYAATITYIAAVILSVLIITTIPWFKGQMVSKEVNCEDGLGNIIKDQVCIEYTYKEPWMEHTRSAMALTGALSIVTAITMGLTYIINAEEKPKRGRTRKEK